MTAGLWLLAAALLAEFARFIAASVRRFRALDGGEFPGDPRKAARLSQSAFEAEEKTELRLGAGYGLRAALTSAALVAATTHTLAAPAGAYTSTSLAALAWVTLAATGVAQLAFLVPAVVVVKRASLDGALAPLGLTVAGGICASALAAGAFSLVGWLLPTAQTAPPQAAPVESPPPVYSRLTFSDFSVEAPAAWDRSGATSLDSYYVTFRAPGGELGYVDVRYCNSSCAAASSAGDYADRHALPGTRSIARAGGNGFAGQAWHGFDVATQDPTVRREVAVQAEHGFFVLGLRSSRERLAELEPAFQRLIESLEQAVRPAFDPRAADWPYRLAFASDSERLSESASVALTRLGAELRADPTARVRIMGYAAPSERDAQALAASRARAVAAVLEFHYEVDPGRIEAGGQVLDGAWPEAAMNVVR